MDLWIGIQIFILSAVCLVRIIVGIIFSLTVYKQQFNCPYNLKVLWHIHPANDKSISLRFMKNMHVHFILSTRPLLAFTIEIVYILWLGLLLKTWIGIWTPKMFVNIVIAVIIIAIKYVLVHVFESTLSFRPVFSKVSHDRDLIICLLFSYLI